MAEPTFDSLDKAISRYTKTRDELLSYSGSVHDLAMEGKQREVLFIQWTTAIVDLAVIGINKLAEAAAESLKSAEAARDAAHTQLKVAEQRTAAVELEEKAKDRRARNFNLVLIALTLVIALSNTGSCWYTAHPVALLQESRK